MSAVGAPMETRSDAGKGRMVSGGHTRLGHIPALDGIRAIAVVAVLLFHAGVAWLPGGFLGVDAFFVLSGFLITSILLSEVATTGKIDFKRFYLGRARRLLPALIAVLLFAALLAVLFAHDAASRVREDSIASIFYVTNWWYVLGEQSYFEAVGRPPMLQHLWSLAVEEQFYLIWPAVLLIVFRRRGRTGVGRVALVGAGLATLLMAFISLLASMPGDQDASRLYFGSDTHSMGILLGAALATLWRPGRLPRSLAPGPQAVLAGLGLSALLGIGWFLHSATEDSGLLYRGGFLVFSGLTAVLIMVASHPALAGFRWLGWQPFRYIGERSYGLYLWHWPVFVVLRPGIDIDWTGTPAVLLQLGITAGLAELSYRYLEMPVRHGAVGRVWRRWRQGRLKLTTRPWLITQGCVAAAALAVGLTLWTLPAPSASDYLGGVTEVGVESLDVVDRASVGVAPGSAPSTAPESASAVSPEAIPPGADLTKVPVTAVGDSVMLGARSELGKVFPKLTLDAAISRQAREVASRVTGRREAGQLAQVVVIHTGTNGPAYASILEPLVAALADRKRVVLVSNHAPDQWVEESNRVIAGLARKYPNVRLADWAGASAGHRDYFYSDGVHTNPAGARAYAQLVAQAVRVD